MPPPPAAGGWRGGPEAAGLRTRTILAEFVSTAFVCHKAVTFLSGVCDVHFCSSSNNGEADEKKRVSFKHLLLNNIILHVQYELLFCHISSPISHHVFSGVIMFILFLGIVVTELLELATELVAEGIVVGELVASEEPGTLSQVAACTIEGSSATERRTLKKITCHLSICTLGSLSCIFVTFHISREIYRNEYTVIPGLSKIATL